MLVSKFLLSPIPKRSRTTTRKNITPCSSRRTKVTKITGMTEPIRNIGIFIFELLLLPFTRIIFESF